MKLKKASRLQEEEVAFDLQAMARWLDDGGIENQEFCGEISSMMGSRAVP